MLLPHARRLSSDLNMREKARCGWGQKIKPESLTYGSSRQHMAALRRGLESPNDAACDVVLEGT